MSDTCVVVLTHARYIPELECDYVGVDQGSFILAERGISMRFAIGDFDSTATESMELIEQFSERIIRLNPIKDDSDSEAALTECENLGYDKIILCGALGGRIDHEIVNLRLAKRYAGKLRIEDEKNRIEWLTPGSYTIHKDDYTYISFFTDGEVKLTLSGFKYPLDHAVISEKDLYTLSNEINENTGVLDFEGAPLLMIQSKDK